MSALYLLDTNIISEPLKAIPDQKVLNSLKMNEGKTALCSPVLHELQYGMERLPASKKKIFILEYINTVIMPSLPILPYGSEAAVNHARLRAKQEAKGLITVYGHFDGLKLIMLGLLITEKKLYNRI